MNGFPNMNSSISVIAVWSGDSSPVSLRGGFI